MSFIDWRWSKSERLVLDVVVLEYLPAQLLSFVGERFVTMVSCWHLWFKCSMRALRACIG